MKYNDVTVLIGDGEPDQQGDSVDIDEVSWPEGGVPVTLGLESDSPVVGHAILKRVGVEVVASSERAAIIIGEIAEEDRVLLSPPMSL